MTLSLGPWVSAARGPETVFALNRIRRTNTVYLPGCVWTSDGKSYLEGIKYWFATVPSPLLTERAATDPSEFVAETFKEIAVIADGTFGRLVGLSWFVATAITAAPAFTQPATETATSSAVYKDNVLAQCNGNDQRKLTVIAGNSLPTSCPAGRTWVRWNNRKDRRRQC